MRYGTIRRQMLLLLGGILLASAAALVTAGSPRKVPDTAKWEAPPTTYYSSTIVAAQPSPSQMPVDAKTRSNTGKVLGAARIGNQPLAGLPLYVENNTPAHEQAKQWGISRPVDAGRMNRLASTPTAKWLGDWNPDPYEEARDYTSAAAVAGGVPVLVLYNLPGRDCGSFSSGGASSATAYSTWINRVASGISGRRALIILEPDATAEADCFTPEGRAAAYQMLTSAITKLKSNPATAVYLDAGNARWQTPETMAPRLNAAGLARADGFALNVSNFLTTAETTAYGNRLSSLTGGKHYVIDTSRNGAGGNGAWCNPEGRALGAVPTTKTGQPFIDGYLWIKTPGESDGECGRGEPTAGVWWPEYALGLAIRAGY